MQKIPYKGYVICPAPLQLADTSQWTIELYISRENDDEIAGRKFSAGNTFPTEQQAIQHCVDFGKQIIDGQSECTVEDL